LIVCKHYDKLVGFKQKIEHKIFTMSFLKRGKYAVEGKVQAASIDSFDDKNSESDFMLRSYSRI